MPDLATVDEALAFLHSLGAPPRLVRHHELVAEAAAELASGLGASLRFDERRVLVGAALHDAGKVLHPGEMSGPGSSHEAEGEALLLARGVPGELARFCRTHAAPLGGVGPGTEPRAPCVAAQKKYVYDVTAMKVIVYSRGAIERVPAQEVPHVIISITSAPDDVARIAASPFTRAVLRLSFADADVAHDAKLVLFDERRAREIAAFVREHRGHAELAVVHCDAGLSRSPAVAAAITKWLGEDDSLWFKRYRPNMLVYRTLLDALMSDPEGGPGRQR